MSWRRDTPPLYDEAAIYAAVAHLAIGQMLPLQVFVSDYDNGSIPRWQIAEREGCFTTLIDLDTLHRSLYGERCYVGIDMIFLPTRCLYGKHYTYFPGCTHARNTFGDARQEARKIAERLAGVKQMSFVSKQRDRAMASH